MNSSLADGDATENVRCPVSRRALVAWLAGALGATAVATVGTAAPAEAPVLVARQSRSLGAGGPGTYTQRAISGSETKLATMYRPLWAVTFPERSGPIVSSMSGGG